MKALKKRLNENVLRGERFTVDGERGILAMARSNDPFYAGQASQVEAAEWFAGLFERLGFEGRRTHIRFVHYAASGEEPNPATGEKHQQLRLDGSPYENTEENWQSIQLASKHARNMGLVDPRNIVDKRTARPFLNAPDAPPEEPGFEVWEPFITFPSIDVADLEPYSSRGGAHLAGYDYDAAFEPSLVEMWMEKSLDDGDDPMIEELCEEEGVNLVTGIGFMTISSVYTLLDRRSKLGKPLRILYLSDFDPAGAHMPGGPARHIEFAIRDMDEKPDIRLCHLALTEAQVKELGLPRPPIKDTDGRKASFEARYGAGAAELNALVSPTRRDQTREMLREAFQGLRDGTLRPRLRDAHREAQQMVDEELGRRLRWPRLALELIEERATEVGERYTEELKDMADRLAQEIEPLEERAQRVLQGARRRLEGLEEAVDLPVVEGEEPPEAADGWLFDSRRDYLEQLEHYKAQ